MPRLLLVDDNQRIHQIAATLLQATDIELICASSGAEALDILAGGGAFDAALVDTTMQGMDGWELLARLRGSGPTATLPIAMMAGVLEGVDEEAVRRAPIQAFLKKPVELRSDLPDRIRALIATPVTAVEPEPAVETAPEVETFSSEDRDLLILGPEDLLEAPEAPAPEETAALPRLDSLELEELDLDSLRDLNLGTPAPESSEAPKENPSLEEMGDLPDFSLEDTYPGEEPETGLLTGVLPDLGPAETAPPPAEAPMALPEDWSDESESLLESPGDATWVAPSWAGPADFGPDSFLDQEEGAEATPAFVPEEIGQPTPLQVPNPYTDTLEHVPPQAITVNLVDEPPAESRGATREFSPVDVELMAEEVFPIAGEPTARDAAPVAAAFTDLAVITPAVPAPAPPAAGASALEAVLADPELMDRLAQAVVARLGDKVLREIAWEVMPEMADRLHRN